MPQVHTNALLATVVDGGYCVGCGACTLGRHDSPLRVEMDQFGMYRAVPAGHPSAIPKDVTTVCPFAADVPSETELARRLYVDEAIFDDHLGFVRQCYAGYVAEGNFRNHGSSGGFCSWLACTMLQHKIVDGVIHVHPTGDARRLFTYKVSYDPATVQLGAKSRYYPVSLSEVLITVRNRPGRYLFIGLPCFVKAVRLLQLYDSVFADRVTYCVSLFCGHLKSRHFSDFLAWQMGFKPDAIDEIDYRVKLPERPASDYGILVAGSGPQGHRKTTVPAKTLYGYDWGLGLFKYKACDYCDDVVGETADVSVGDAWLPDFERDSLGTNIVVTRNRNLDQLVQSAIADGRLHMQPIGIDSVIASQAGGFRHRREGLSFRLYLCDKKGIWRPSKRVPASNRLPKRRQNIYILREQLREASHRLFFKAIHTGDYSLVLKGLSPLVDRYTSYYKPSFLGLIISRIRSLLRRR